MTSAILSATALTLSLAHAPALAFPYPCNHTAYFHMLHKVQSLILYSTISHNPLYHILSNLDSTAVTGILIWADRLAGSLQLFPRSVFYADSVLTHIMSI